MSIADADIASAVAAYLDRYPDEKALLAGSLQRLTEGNDFASRCSFPMHVTVGALLTRGGTEVLLVGHRAYGILLQPGGHLEPADATLIGAAVRELVEEPASMQTRLLPYLRRPSMSSTAGCRLDR